VIVLDDEHIGMVTHHRPQGAGPRRVECRAGRVLRPRRDHTRCDAALERRRERLGNGTTVIDRDRNRDEPERRKEVEDAREPGILDRDAVARPQPGQQHPFDAVERAAHREHPLGGHTVGAQRATRRLVERGQGGRLAVALGVVGERAQVRPQRGQERAIRVAT
jgi:hypothetical protein